MSEGTVIHLSHSVERAKALAADLHAFRPQTNLPAPLWEAAFLLAEAQNEQRPTLERLRILGLMATSLDQFFVDQFPQWQELAPDHPETARQLATFPIHVEQMLLTASATLQETIFPSLSSAYAVRIVPPQMLEPAAQSWLRSFFHERVYPLLTPLAIDPSHPFPFISSFSLNFLAHLRPGTVGELRSASAFARIKVPRLLPRLIQIPEPVVEAAGAAHQRWYVQSEELVRFFLPDLFPGLYVESAYLFRVLRAAETGARHEPLGSFRARQRQMNLPVVRLDVEHTMPAHRSAWLVEHLQLPAYACYSSSDPMSQLHLIEVANLIEGVAYTAPPSIFANLHA